MNPLNPTDEQLQNRLNPTPTKLQFAPGGLFYDSNDYWKEGVYSFDPTSNSYARLNLRQIAQDELTKLGRGRQTPYGLDYGMSGADLITYGNQLLKDRYGVDTSTIQSKNFADSPQFKISDMTPEQLKTLMTAPPTQAPDVTVNQPQPAGTPGTVPVPQGTPNTLQPTSQPTAQTPTQTPTPTYTIQAGDTLGKIAQQYGTTVGELMSLNPNITDANKIYTGQKLNLRATNTAQQSGGNTQAPQGMVDQANNIQSEINKLQNSSTGTQTGTQTTQTTPPPQTTSDFVKTYQDIYSQLGLKDIKSAYTKTLEDAKALQDKKDEEAQEINNNPWFSQGKRDLEMRKLESKYETKLNTLSNYAKLYDAQYQERQAEAEFLATGVQKDTQFNMELAQKKIDALSELSADNTVVSANGRELLVNKSTGKVVADLGASKTDTSLAQILSAVTGKPLTDAERLAQGYATRMVASDSIIAQIGNQFANPNAFGGLLPNVLQSSDRQSYEQAKRDFVNAVLRRESGAAISPSEFDSADKQYFPQAGDSTNVIAQKAANRQLKIQALQFEGGMGNTNQQASNHDYLSQYLTTNETTKKAYLPRGVWATIPDKDAVLAEAKADGYELLIND